MLTNNGTQITLYFLPEDNWPNLGAGKPALMKQKVHLMIKILKFQRKIGIDEEEV